MTSLWFNLYKNENSKAGLDFKDRLIFVTLILFNLCIENKDSN
jgi:hypothetical protein